MLHGGLLYTFLLIHSSSVVHMNELFYEFRNEMKYLLDDWMFMCAWNFVQCRWLCERLNLRITISFQVLK